MKLKEKLRRSYLKTREGLEEGKRKKLSELIVNRLLSLSVLKSARRLLLFCPHKGEPDITPLFKWALCEGKDVVLPKVEGEELKLIRVSDTEGLEPGSFCILEPTEGEEVSPESVELSLIPGVVFDKKGYRLGFGRGYYDRLMDRLGGLKVGVAYEFQIVEEVPRDSWDRPVDMVVTEENIYGGKVS